MKIKSLRLLFSLLFCGVLLMACFLFVPSKVWADEKKSAVAVLEKGEKITKPNPYGYNKEGKDLTLCIADFNFEDNYTVAYYFKKLNSDSVVFNYLGTIDNSLKGKDGKEIKDEEGNVKPNPNRELTKNFFIDYGAGEYLIKAIILCDGEILAFPNDLKLTIEDLDQENLKAPTIIVKNLGVVSGEYEKYNFSIQFKKDDELVTYSNCEVNWYYNEKYFIGSGESVDWTPTQEGDYKISAKIKIGQTSYETDPPYKLTVKKNYSLYAIIALAGVAVVLTTIVVITTIRKVRKERVW